jgi:hypothetical protein
VARQQLEKTLQEIQAQQAQAQASTDEATGDLDRLKAEMAAARQHITKLEDERRQAQGRMGRYADVTSQLPALRTYLREARALCRARKEQLEKDVTRVAGDLFLFCASAHYLGECGWALRRTVMQAWRRLCSDYHDVPTSSGDGGLGVLSDDAQARYWTSQPTDQALYGPGLPPHHSWLDSAAFALACAGWPFLVDPSIDQPVLAWLRTVHKHVHVRLFIIPAVQVTKKVLEQVLDYQKGEYKVS